MFLLLGPLSLPDTQSEYSSTLLKIDLKALWSESVPCGNARMKKFRLQEAYDFRALTILALVLNTPKLTYPPHGLLPARNRKTMVPWHGLQDKMIRQ